MIGNSVSPLVAEGIMLKIKSKLSVSANPVSDRGAA
jgi:hypothetical protein